MSALTFKPEAAVERVGEKTLAVPALQIGVPATLALRSAKSAHGLRSRFNATRLQVGDDGFRLFRVY